MINRMKKGIYEKKKKTLGDGFSVSATLLLEMLLRKKTEATHCASL